jgi:hypothetical protein
LLKKTHGHGRHQAHVQGLSQDYNQANHGHGHGHGHGQGQDGQGQGQEHGCKA